MKDKILLIDADTIVWQIAYKFSQEETFEGLAWMVENMTKQWMLDLSKETNCKYYIGVLQDEQPTFRHNLALSQPYKGTRKEKPEWYIKVSPIVRKVLQDVYQFKIASGIESDDVISILMGVLKDGEYEGVVAGIDKDLLQIPGMNYNYNTKQWLLVHKEVAERNLWKQVLMGDSTDSIQGLPGIGPKKAEAILDQVEVDKYPFVVLAAYIGKFGDRVGLLKFAETVNLVTLLTEGEIDFEPILNPFYKDSPE